MASFLNNTKTYLVISNIAYLDFIGNDKAQYKCVNVFNIFFLEELGQFWKKNPPTEQCIYICINQQQNPSSSGGIFWNLPCIPKFHAIVIFSI